jgi:hypothetical protein
MNTGAVFEASMAKARSRSASTAVEVGLFGLQM